MIINKNYNQNTIKLIVKKYLEWINSGVSPSDILVLAFNSNSKKNILKSILNLTQKKVFSDIKIQTFNSLIYNSVLDNWPAIENIIKNGTPLILPNMSGMEVSQFILKNILSDEDVKGYNSKKSLLHQIFRRYSLITNNHLTQQEIIKKSNILKESFGEDAENIIKKLRAHTLNLRSFDNNRQSQIFTYLYQNTDCFKNIKYLIAEDVDEATPLFFDFLKNISGQLKDKLIILDKDGGSRIGYLCAEPNSYNLLKEIFNEEIIDKEKTPQNITYLTDNILNDTKYKIENLSVVNTSKRLDMIEETILQVNNLINKGISPGNISIITPIQDKMLKYSLIIGLKNCIPNFLSGSEKQSDNPLVKAILTILKLSVGKEVKDYDLRIILTKYLGIPAKLLNSPNIKNLETCDIGSYTEIYNRLRELVHDLATNSYTISEKAYIIYSKLINNVDKTDLTKFNFFLKELQNFERVFKNSNIQNIEHEIINQIENSIVSDNPYTLQEFSEQDLVISTPQKIIDNKIKTKYQFWLDISSQEWIKSDIGPLYNSWVFQKSWDKNEYTIEDNIRLSKLKTSKILRKLMLNTDKVIALSCLFDTQGVENIGGIEQYLISDNMPEQKQSKPFKIIPRKDQQPVLEYKSGKMAISAVPGAGKTTILLALIIELMKKDINPENIYVLTYMESAARNFKDRISAGVNVNKMPYISTIHGLALRILKENSNYERLGLNSDFDICDDTQRGNIIKSLSEDLKKTETEDFDRAISVFKLSKIDFESNEKISYLLNLKKGTSNEMKLSKFLKFFFKYQQKLKSENLIDYDDILISSVKLLEENPDIREYYQNICEYIIEDEAQDSSSIQQRLINLLSAKHKNLIRCGDINQAITTTFTNADVEGFKKFIETSERVDMNCSQRCSEGVWKLANELVKYGNKHLNSPFYEIFMRPVENRNPVEAKPVISKIFQTGMDEKLGTVNEIKKILSKNPDATIGVLLRNNYQVNNWASYLSNSGLSTITRNDCLGQKKIFKVIFSILKSISNPYDNTLLADAYKSLSECGILRPHLEQAILEFGDCYISLNNDDIFDSDLARFHWDMNYWLSFPELTIDELAMMIGLNYFSDNLEKSNIHLISTLCAKLNNGDFSQTIQKLEGLSTRPTLSGFKFFSEDEGQDLTEGKIQLMTLHKSKGDEFDYVFLPEMTEKNLTLDMDKLTIKKSSDFMENVKTLSKDYKPKTETELKEFLISENYRLLYVAITRAKKRLYFSAPATEVYFGKQRDCESSIIFDALL